MNIKWFKQITYYSFKVALNSGSQVTIDAYVKLGGSYSGSNPVITLSGLSLDSTATYGGAGDSGLQGDGWHLLTISGTPNTDGVATLKIEAMGSTDDSEIYVDDISVSQ